MGVGVGVRVRVEVGVVRISYFHYFHVFLKPLVSNNFWQSRVRPCFACDGRHTISRCTCSLPISVLKLRLSQTSLVKIRTKSACTEVARAVQPHSAKVSMFIIRDGKLCRHVRQLNTGALL